MGIRLDSIIVENFKSYGERTQIPVSGLSVLMGANSSGKSTALQTLLAVKQTIECNSPDIDLLLSGKYTMLEILRMRFIMQKKDALHSECRWQGNRTGKIMMEMTVLK